MTARRWYLLAGTVGVLAACQAPPATGPAPSPGASAAPPASAGPSVAPSGAATMSPAPAATPSALASVSPSPAATAVDREVVLGSIYNDDGGMVERAQVIIDADDPAFDRTIDAAGGAYGLRDVPVGTTLSITATAPGHSSRTRRLTVRRPIPFHEEAPNRVDFGGPDGPGYWYFLSDHPEVSYTEPDNLAKDVDLGEALEVVFRFSDAIADTDRGDFERLVRVTVPAPPSTSATPTASDTGVLAHNTAVGPARMLFTWADEGKTCTMRFPLPIVTRIAGSAITVELDQGVVIANWPEGVSGRVLGFAKVPRTFDGSGSRRSNSIAAFARRPTIEAPVPTTRPEADELWGTTHMTSIRFEGRRDLTPPRVTKVVALQGSVGEDDTIELTFDKPVYGFPAGAISEETRRPGNFRLVYGSTSDRKEREAFEQADPTRTGGIPSNGIEFDEREPNVLILHDAPGAFGDRTRFKLFVDPKVEDVHGAPVGGEGQVLEGEL